MNQNKQAEEKGGRTAGHCLTYIHEEGTLSAAEPTVWLTCSH